MLFIEENVYNFCNSPPTWLFSAWEIASATCKLGTLGHFSGPRHKYSRSVPTSCWGISAHRRAPMCPFPSASQSTLVSCVKATFACKLMGDSGCSPKWVPGQRTKMLVWGCVLWHPPIGQHKYSKKNLCGVLCCTSHLTAR